MVQVVISGTTHQELQWINMKNSSWNSGHFFCLETEFKIVSSNETYSHGSKSVCLDSKHALNLTTFAGPLTPHFLGYNMPWAKHYGIPNDGGMTILHMYVYIFKGCRPCRRPRKRETGNGVSWLRSSVLWIVSLDALYIHCIYIYASNSIYLYVEVKFC